jgi:hypothetical protein
LTGTDPEFEVAFTGSRIGSPRGASGVALIADDAHNYKPARHWGEHGGATLAEVVTPTLLLGWDGMDQELDDEELAIRPPHRPSWWFFDVRTIAPEQSPRSKPPRSSRAAKDDRPTAQIDLIAAPPAPPPASPPTVPPPLPRSPLAEQLARSEEFLARAAEEPMRRKVLDAVAYLAERGGLAPTAAFATALGLHDWRVPHIVARYGEILNVDGYLVLQHDPRAQQVILDRDSLVQCFDLPKLAMMK